MFCLFTNYAHLYSTHTPPLVTQFLTNIWVSRSPSVFYLSETRWQTCFQYTLVLSNYNNSWCTTLFSINSQLYINALLRLVTQSNQLKHSNGKRHFSPHEAQLSNRHARWKSSHQLNLPHSAAVVTWYLRPMNTIRLTNNTVHYNLRKRRKTKTVRKQQHKTTVSDEHCSQTTNYTPSPMFTQLLINSFTPSSFYLYYHVASLSTSQNIHKT